MCLLAQHFTSEGGSDTEVKTQNISPPSRNHLPPALVVEPRISGIRATGPIRRQHVFKLMAEQGRVLTNFLAQQKQGGDKDSRSIGCELEAEHLKRDVQLCYSLYFRALVAAAFATLRCTYAVLKAPPDMGPVTATKAME